MIARLPGCLSDEDLSPTLLAAIRAAGFAWVAPQVQNGHVNKDRDLAAIRGAGLSAPVWGVSYAQGDFGRDGFNLGRQAVKLGASSVIANVEEAAKGTRASRGLRPLVDAIRHGGWPGTVHLNTVGPPVNPDVNDHAIDVESFLETGGGIFTQAHFNETDSYRPALAVRYWTRVGVPRERLNVQISVYPAESDKEKPGTRLSGAEWVPLLEEAGVAFSVFRAEGATPDDLAALSALTKGDDMAEKIGPDHGIDAWLAWMNRQPGAPVRLPAYDPANPKTWPMQERVARTLRLLAAEHDARA